jgi:hypothetical protein
MNEVVKEEANNESEKLRGDRSDNKGKDEVQPIRKVRDLVRITYHLELLGYDECGSLCQASLRELLTQKGKASMHAILLDHAYDDEERVLNPVELETYTLKVQQMIARSAIISLKKIVKSLARCSRRVTDATQSSKHPLECHAEIFHAGSKRGFGSTSDGQPMPLS